jgi:anti-sigma factor RsiW
VSDHAAPDDRLSGYLDDELDPAERRAIESYLAASPEWRAALEEVAWARDALRHLPVHEAPSGFWEAALAPELADVRARRRRHGRGPRIAALSAAAAAVAAVVAAAVVVPSPDRVRPEVPAVADAHTVRASVTGDPATQLATVSLVTPFRR